MYLTNNLISEVFETPYNEGYRNLEILSGYVSPAFVDYILSEFEELILNITVGMVSHEGLSLSHHNAFKKLENKYKGQLKISYQVNKPGNHRKVYYWMENGFYNLSAKVYLGSANFSYNGFVKQKEVLVEATFDNVDIVFEDLQTMGCNDPFVEQNISFYNLVPQKKNIRKIEQKVLIPEKVITNESNNIMDYVDISLLSKKGVVPARSGLNWGQRDNRDKNQAYLAVINEIHKKDPTFFPELAEPFIMLTDDGESLVCVMAQANRKGIHTREKNSIMGAYFRKRLGLADGEFVKTEHVLNYGRTFVRIYKIDNETYYMDFSVDSK